MNPKAKLVQAVLNKKKQGAGEEAGETTPDNEKTEGAPSAGMSKNAKSSAVKQAKSGKDMGAKGKNFAKIAAKAGGGEKGKKIAGAVFWKTMKKRGA